MVYITRIRYIKLIQILFYSHLFKYEQKLKCCIVGEFSVEENAISSKRWLNDDFVEQFDSLNIELTTSDIEG